MMFADELDRIDRALRSPRVVMLRRRSIYFEFRDSSEPYERLVPIAPRRVPVAFRAGDGPCNFECGACGRHLGSAEAVKEHTQRHHRCKDGMRRVKASEEAISRVRLRTAFDPAPGAFLKWTCAACGRFVYRWADSGLPRECACCHGCKWTASPWTGRAE